MPSFSDFRFHDGLLAAVTEAGYDVPTPIQAEAIPPILKGKDVIGIAQTGTGKTAAFVLPILHKLATNTRPKDLGLRTEVLILAPTRELVIQIEANARAYAKHLPGVSIIAVYGGVGEQAQRVALRDHVSIVIATPGRLLDLLDQGYGEFKHVTHFIVDEADRMLDMGFLPSLQRVLDLLPPRRQTLLFSATFNHQVEELAKQIMVQPQLAQIGKRAMPATTVRQAIYEVHAKQKVELLKHLLTRDEVMQMVIVFTHTKSTADKLARELRQAGIATGLIHADRSQYDRKRTLEQFSGWETRVLVCTDIAARGIDIEGITHVVNFDAAFHSDNYVHRVGRTGRAGAKGEAITFVVASERGIIERLEKAIGRTLPRLRAAGFAYNNQSPVEELEWSSSSAIKSKPKAKRDEWDNSGVRGASAARKSAAKKAPTRRIFTGGKSKRPRSK